MEERTGTECRDYFELREYKRHFIGKGVVKSFASTRSELYCARTLAYLARAQRPGITSRRILVQMLAAEGGALQQAKLVLLGDMGAGKSSVVLRFVKGQFFDYQVKYPWSQTSLDSL